MRGSRNYNQGLGPEGYFVCWGSARCPRPSNEFSRGRGHKPHQPPTRTAHALRSIFFKWECKLKRVSSHSKKFLFRLWKKWLHILIKRYVCIYIQIRCKNRMKHVNPAWKNPNIIDSLKHLPFDGYFYLLWTNYFLKKILISNPITIWPFVTLSVYLLSCAIKKVELSSICQLFV